MSLQNRLFESIAALERISALDPEKESLEIERSPQPDGPEDDCPPSSGRPPSYFSSYEKAKQYPPLPLGTMAGFPRVQQIIRAVASYVVPPAFTFTQYASWFLPFLVGAIGSVVFALAVDNIYYV